MKLQYASDLHLEFPQNKKFLKSNPIQPVGDVLLLAGDIMLFAQMDKHADFFSYLSDNFKTTYWLPGNHEYYHSDIKERSGYLNEKIRDNVFLVNNTTIQIEKVRFIFSTLWTKISPGNQFEISQRLSDFHTIKVGDRGLTPEHYNFLHEQCISFLKKEFSKEKPGKTIVITHHVPTFLNYPEKFKGDVLNEAFGIELFDLIEAHGFDYWIYGHSHHNTIDFEIGNTKMRTNQMGYVEFNEQKGFNEGEIIEI